MSDWKNVQSYPRVRCRFFGIAKACTLNKQKFEEPLQLAWYLVLEKLLEGIPGIPLGAVATQHLRALDEFGRAALLEEALPLHNAKLGATARNATLLLLLLMAAARAIAALL